MIQIHRAEHVILTKPQMETILFALNFYQEEGVRDSGPYEEHKIIDAARASISVALKGILREELL
jgi:hypothetical protein